MEHGILAAVFCEICLNIFLNTAELKHHIETNHTVSSPSYCSMCDYIYQNIDDLNMHVQSVHGTNPEDLTSVNSCTFLP